ncbi:MAG: DUF4846 domain-containing protein [Candidatus Edwardsbacteria bacterium]|nr:DUF4846 domain-containing protein [Candidatus Edwardsbacteria bacterium]
MVPSICQARGLKDVPTPSGYARVQYADSSYSGWIQRLPIKDDDVILGYDGEPVISSFYSVLAVVDMPMLFSRDLEQCADWCFRFRAEYFKQTKRLKQLYLFDYNGKRRYYRDSGQTYKGFLRWTMGNANSYSLKKGCRTVAETDLRPGDMLVQNQTGGVGHVSVVMDVCRDDKGNERYLIGYSFMPAQQFHIERAGGDKGKKGWFSIPEYRQYLRLYLDFGDPIYKRF